MKRLITFLCIQVSITLGILGAVTETFDDESVFPAFGLGGITATQHTGAFGDWTLYDGNGMKVYGLTDIEYENKYEPSAWMVFNHAKTNPVHGNGKSHSGKQCMMSIVPIENHVPATTDHWIISPELSGEAQTITFYTRQLTTQYGNEKYQVLASSTNNEPTSFFIVGSTREITGEDWQEVSVSLPAGTKFFAIRHISYDIFAMLVDDITYEPKGSTGSDDGDPSEGTSGLEYVLDDATKTAKVTYRIKEWGDGTWERIKGGYHGDIVIPETHNGYTVTGIDEYAFDQCTDIPSVKLPKTLKQIEYSAFNGCTALKEIIIPASVDTIYNTAFDGCSALENVVFEDGTNVLKLGVGSSSAESGMFTWQPIKSVYIGRPYRYPKQKDWGWYVYYDLSAFGRCTTLEEVTFGENVTEIQPFEFILCSSLKKVTINGTITSLAEKAFYRCEKLKTINLPEGLTTIGIRAFEFCKELESITFPSTLTMIDEYAFGTCESIKSLTIPASVGSLGLAAFTACSSLKELTLEDGPYELRLTHGEGGNSGYFTERPLEKVYVGRPINHPETGWLGYRAGAFSGIKTLKEAVVGEYVTELPVNEFMDSGLSTISLPKNLTKIGNFALSGCSSLNSITCEAVTPPTCGDNVFNTTDKKACKLYVPLGSVDSYKTANVWKEFFNIESGINAITIDGALDGKVYNLNGQQINGQATQKGLYILNGKKFIKK